MRKVYFIDHYDSFSFNLLDWLAQALPAYNIERVLYDDASAMQEVEKSHAPIIISPGPKHPKDVVETLQLVKSKLGQVPIFGVCLGHQVLGYVLGYEIKKSITPFHGSSRAVDFLKSDGTFASLFGRSNYASYNSLCVCLPSESEEVAALNNYGEVEAMEINLGEYPAIGVQFHPESFLSENKKDLQKIWKSLVDNFYASS